MLVVSHCVSFRFDPLLIDIRTLHLGILYIVCSCTLLTFLIL